MRFMMIVKATPDSEAGRMPSKNLIDAMGAFNEEMMKAGIMLGGDGLQPSSKGARVRFSNGKTTVIDGPFTETKELIAGFWIIDVKSREEALAWARRCPPPFENQDCELEIRPFFEASDFPPEVLSPEAAQREKAMRDELQKKANRP